MATDFGFNFRDTAAYVTDPTGTTFIIGNGTDPEINYPTTKTVNGVSITFGWETNAGLVGCRNRDNTIDHRIAGINFMGNASSLVTFRVDLPSTGSWGIGLAIGDGANGSSQTNYINILDTASSVLSFQPVINSATGFVDAAGNQWTVAQWPGSNVTVSKTFTTTICRLVIGSASGSGTFSCISHFRVFQTGIFTKSVSDTISITDSLKNAVAIKYNEVITLADVIKRAITVKYQEVYSIVERLTVPWKITFHETISLIEQFFTFINILPLTYFRNYLGDIPPVVEEASAIEAPSTYDGLEYMKDYLI